MLKDYPAGFRTFIIRTVIFLILFIVVTGILGPWIISTKLLYGFHFFIYGNLGKLVLLSSIAFILLTRKKLFHITVPPYQKKSLAYIVYGFLLIPVFFIAGERLLQHKSFSENIVQSLMTHALLICIPIMIAYGVFGAKFVRRFLKEYKKEIGICIAISFVFYLAIFYVWRLWPYFSAAVLAAVTFLFRLTFDRVYVFPPRTISVNNFSVVIAEPCSGVDSLFLFSSLYLLIAIMDWKEFNKKKIILMFFPAALGLFLVNILRVYLLILIGVLISPELTIKLFHTYLGMVLFIIYFAVFWKLFYGWMKKSMY